MTPAKVANEPLFALKSGAWMWVLRLCLLLMMKFVSTAQATPVASDSFAGRPILAGALPLRARDYFSDATVESGERLRNRASKSVWISWTATSSAPVSFYCSFTGISPTISVYKGSILSELTVVSDSEENPDFGNSQRLQFNATAGVSYSIQIAARGYAPLFDLYISYYPNPPANDDFQNAVPLFTGSEASGTTEAATLQQEEAIPEGVNVETYHNSAWWKWTAEASGWHELKISGNYQSLATVWAGNSLQSLTQVGAVENAPKYYLYYQQKSLFFQALAGEQYWISIGSHQTEFGSNVSLQMSQATSLEVEMRSISMSATSLDATASDASITSTFQVTSTTPVLAGRIYLLRPDDVIQEVHHSKNGAAWRDSRSRNFHESCFKMMNQMQRILPPVRPRYQVVRVIVRKGN